MNICSECEENETDGQVCSGCASGDGGPISEWPIELGKSIELFVLRARVEELTKQRDHYQTCHVAGHAALRETHRQKAEVSRKLAETLLKPGPDATSWREDYSLFKHWFRTALEVWDAIPVEFRGDIHAPPTLPEKVNAMAQHIAQLERELERAIKRLPPRVRDDIEFPVEE